MSYTYEHPRPAVTVDVALFTIQGKELGVLVIRRAHEPFAGMWALPGGFVDENEALHVAAARELEEETGVRGVALEQLGAFGDPRRDPRGHTISVAFLSFAVATSLRVKPGDDASEATWVPVRTVLRTPTKRKNESGLAFDHALIIQVARQRLRAHLELPTKSAPFELVPPRFTMAEFQLVYEAVLGTTVAPRTFAARLHARGLVEPVPTKGGRESRGAKLYRWRADK